MTVAATTVELEFTNVVVNVPLVVPIQSYSTEWFQVRYGDNKELATPGADYTIEYDNPADPTYLSFNFTPLTALLTKIGAGTNVVYISRKLPLTTDFDNDDAFVREKIVTEFDKLWMTAQQLDEEFTDTADAAASAAAAAASAATAAAMAAAAAASATAIPSASLIIADGSVTPRSLVNRPAEHRPQLLRPIAVWPSIHDQIH